MTELFRVSFNNYFVCKAIPLSYCLQKTNYLEKDDVQQVIPSSLHEWFSHSKMSEALLMMF